MSDLKSLNLIFAVMMIFPLVTEAVGPRLTDSELAQVERELESARSELQTAEDADDRRTANERYNMAIRKLQTDAQAKVETARIQLRQAVDGDEQREANQILEQAIARQRSFAPLEHQQEVAEEIRKSREKLRRASDTDDRRDADRRLTETLSRQRSMAQNQVDQARDELQVVERSGDADDRREADKRLKAAIDRLRAVTPETAVEKAARELAEAKSGLDAAVDGDDRREANLRLSAALEQKRALAQEDVNQARRQMDEAQRSGDIDDRREANRALTQALDQQAAVNPVSAKTQLDRDIAAAKRDLKDAVDGDDRHEANQRLSKALDQQKVAGGDQFGNPQPGTEVSAAPADPCRRPGMSARQAEDCSMKKLKENQDDADIDVARCFYSGFAASNNETTNKCTAVKSTADAKKLGIQLQGVKDTNCGKDMVMCNPLVFGVQSDQRAICVRNSKGASKDCANKANLKSPDAQARYKELMKDNDNKNKRADLEKKLKRSCSETAMKTDRAFTSKIKIRKDTVDHKNTCEVLDVAVNKVKEITRETASIGKPTRNVLPAPASGTDGD